MYVVGFNGPPGCGKDTLAQMLVEHMDSRITVLAVQTSLSFPLRRVAYAMTGFSGKLDGSDYDFFKRAKFPIFGNRTGRELLIYVSETFLKPVFGQRILADMLMSSYQDFPGLLLIRDSGFQCEINPIIETVGKENLYIVRVDRPGCTFEFDSREWVSHPKSSNEMWVKNYAGLDELRVEAGRIYGRLVNQMGWKL